MKRKIVFVFGNRPLPLLVNIFKLLEDTGEYHVELIYQNRVKSPVSVPMTDRIRESQCSAITWPVGRSRLAKTFNRIITIGLFVKKIRSVRPQVIHAWNLDALIAARLAAIGRHQTKIIFTLQDTTEYMLSEPFKILQRWAYWQTDLIFVTSQQFESHFLRKFHLISNEKKVLFVPNVPPSRLFATFQPRRIKQEITVGYIGAFKGAKGITMLVEAARLARLEGCNIKVLFAGIGLDRGLVESLACENHFVDYFGPYQYDTAILDLYAKVDLIYAIYNQTYDKNIHLAYRLSEAVNCRIPIIVADGTYMSEVVKAYDIGVSISFGDIEGLANVFIELYRNKKEIMRLSGNCETVRERFIFETYQRTICDGYRDL